MDAKLVARFWAKVDKNGPGGCWIWTGAKDGRGYGMFHIGLPKITRRAHRVSLMIAGLEVPDWERDAPAKPLVVDHICKRLACVNPDHLRLVTQKFNSTTNSFYRTGVRSL
jgi:hypothetical protein